MLNEPIKILGKDIKYTYTAVFVPIIEIDGALNYLFERRSLQISQGSEISFPGGKYDARVDSCGRDTAIRETSEELGIATDRIQDMHYIGTIIAPMGVYVDAFMGRLTIQTLDEFHIKTSEIDEILCVPVAWFQQHVPQQYHVSIDISPYGRNEQHQQIDLLPSKALHLPEKYQQPWGGHRYPVYVYCTPRGVIWGITAEIIRETLIQHFTT